MVANACAMCSQFHIRYNPKHAAVGLGLCKLPTPGSRVEKFYPAGAPACPSFSAAKDGAGARAAFLKKFQEVV